MQQVKTMRIGDYFEGEPALLRIATTEYGAYNRFPIDGRSLNYQCDGHDTYLFSKWQRCTEWGLQRDELMLLNLLRWGA
jgi:hypothetical protein